LVQTAFDESEDLEDEFEEGEDEWEEPVAPAPRPRLPARRRQVVARDDYVPEYAPEPRAYAPAPRAYVSEPHVYAPEPRAREPRGYAHEPRAYAPQQQLQLPAPPPERVRPAMQNALVAMDQIAERPALLARGTPGPRPSVAPPPKKWWSRRGAGANEAFAEHAGGRFVAEAMPRIGTDGIPSTLDAPALTMTGSTREILARLEARRGSRVIAIIHREHSKRNWLDVLDLEDALTAIRKAPKNKPLDIILHSGGGLIRAAQQIARAIHAHPAKTTVFVPYYALGSITFMAFAADEIVMSAHAALSPVDPFVGAGPASSVLAGIKGKPVERIEDETIIAADIAKKMLDEARRLTCELMTDGRENAGVCRLADELVSGKWSRDRAITAPIAKELGLTVSLQMPNDVYELVRSCRRSAEHETTSVAYLDDGERREVHGDSYRDRPRLAAPVGVLDSGIAAITERERLPAVFPQYRRGVSRSVWLAHAGVEVPAAAADRAEALIRRIEEVRGSRVVCVIHGENMENDQFNFADLEDVLSALVASDPSRPLDIILHTQGGNSFAGRQIARAIKAHPARKTVFVPYFAMSAGTRVALAADQIVMGVQATLGPIDTQLYGMPAPSILQLLAVKPHEAIKDEFLILAEEARKIMAEGHATACDLLQGTYSDDGSCAIADEMIGGKWSHGFPIMANVARVLGLNVSTDLPDIFYELVRCFRHADGEDPSVLFIPR
jgi:ClpP class serine protease